MLKISGQLFFGACETCLKSVWGNSVGPHQSYLLSFTEALFLLPTKFNA